MALQLGLDVMQTGDLTTVVAVGELDACSSRQVDALADELLHDGRLDVVVDLRRLEFADSAGMLALARLAEKLAARGGRLALDTPPRSVRTVVRVLDLAFSTPENLAVA